MSKIYNRRTCCVCGCDTSTAGAAFASHMKKHVREGRAVQVKRNYGKRYGIEITYEKVKSSLPAAQCSAANVESEPEVEQFENDRQRVEAAWATVLKLGGRLESCRESVRLTRNELLAAVKEANKIEEETGVKW